MRNLSGKVAIVTGGASGIGFGMARAFPAEGEGIPEARNTFEQARREAVNQLFALPTKD